MSMMYASKPREAGDSVDQADPRTKKRLQNRRAQKVYRDRIKERISELEAKVRAYEGTTTTTQSENKTLQAVAVGSRAPQDIEDNIQVIQHVAEASAPTSQQSRRPTTQTSTGNNDVVLTDTDVSAGVAEGNFDFFLGTLTDEWRDENFAPLRNHPDIVAPALGVQAEEQRSESSVCNQPTAGLFTPPHTAGSICSNDSPLQRKIEIIMECAATSGFDNFDELARTYYTADFEGCPQIVNEQRVSRRRRLPLLIGHLFESANNWNSRERAEFHEELLKSVESLLKTEYRSAWASIGQLSEMEFRNQSQLPVHDHGVAVMANLQKTIERELPNLWTFMMSLSGSNGSLWQRKRSDTALATILLLQLSGRMDKDLLLELIGACL